MTQKPTSEGLEFALANLRLTGANDILPPSHFVGHVVSSWSYLKPALADLDIAAMVPTSPRHIYLPKSNHAFRVCHDLSLIDFLLLTAFTFDIAARLEARREPADAERVFSHRLKISSGNFYSSDEYELFRRKCVELASDGNTSYVLSLDIADCYNQISTHRVGNALVESSIDHQFAKAFEQHLITLNLRSSVGIPVGQDFARLLAEVALATIDDALNAKQAKWTRFVDDIRVFCSTYGDALMMLHDLTKVANRDILKLTINDSKTRIYKSETFLALESVDPAKQEQSERAQRYNAIAGELLERIKSEHDYMNDLKEEDLPEEILSSMKNTANVQAMQKLFVEACVAEGVPDYRMVRHLLNTARRASSSILIDLVITHIEKLLPVFKNVATYFVAVANDFRPNQAAALHRFCKGGNGARLQFVREWICHLILVKPNLFSKESAEDILIGWSSQASHFKYAFAGTYNVPELVREDKPSWQQLGPLERAWLIWSARILPEAERSALDAAVLTAGTLFEHCIVKGR